MRALRAEGLAVGLYFSPDDFYRLHTHGKTIARAPHPGVTPQENPGLLEYDRAQLRELMSAYGPVDIVFLDGPAEGLRELVWEMQPTAVVTRGAIETPEQRVPSGRRPLRRNFIRNCMVTCSLRQDRPESISRRTCAASPAASTRNHAVPSRRTRQGRATQMFEDCRWDPILSESAQLRAAGFRHVIL